MELLYVWIERYKNIHHQGFNFSPRYRFKFEPKFKMQKVKDEKGQDKEELPKDTDGKVIYEVIGGTLTDAMSEEERKNALPDNFFGKDIANVTAIVGQNGAGKSNLIEAILTSMDFLKKEDSEKMKYLIVYSEDSTEKEKAFFIQHNYESELIPRDFAFEKKNIGDVSSIFLSNVFDNKNLIFDDENKKGYDLTTNSLLRNSSKGDKIYQYQQDEFKHQIDFAVEFGKKEYESIFPFDIPKNIFIGMYNTYNWFHSDMEGKGYDYKDTTFRENLKIFAQKIDKLKGGIGKGRKINDFLEILFFRILYFVMAYPFNIKGNVKKTGEYQDIFKTIFEKLNNELGVIQELNEANISKLFDIIQDHLVLKLSNKDYLNNLKAFIEASKKIKDYVKKGEIQGNYLNFQCKTIDEKNRESFKIFLKSYSNTFNTPETQKILYFGWEGMSSGQLAMLNIFARLYSVRENLKDNESIILFIDEGELYLHADWQKRFLNSMLKALPVIFKGKTKTIQIIVTSHTPFVLSDIPKENVIFLKQGEDGEKFSTDGTDAKGKCIVIDGLNEKKQTFGANIHTLLSDSFFLEGGLIGEFAKGKINEAIKYLNDGASDHIKLLATCNNLSELEITQKIVNLIGEPIIKSQLQKRIDSKRIQGIESKVKDIEKIKEDIAKLQEQLNNLQNRDGVDNDD